MTPLQALRTHWPEYLIEAWGLGSFMIAAGLVATALGSPTSSLSRMVVDPLLRNVVAGIAMGLTAIALIHSPWGRRSGAHLNPAVTLTFLRLGKTHGWDALFYVIAQLAGGTAGVLLVASLLGPAFTDAPVSYAATMPGTGGAAVAFVAEMIISAVLMFVILTLSGTPRFAGLTGFAAGTLVALYISFESPLSGMSMNPARTFASAAPAMQWDYYWIYVCAPLIGMLTAAQMFLAIRGVRRLACAKLLHADDQRCIHCGYDPAIGGSKS
ncbi:MAG: aquaporin [Proteobacteria bacterium]|nr:aquaporin [Pseudomonadota bacterium]